VGLKDCSIKIWINWIWIRIGRMGLGWTGFKDCGINFKMEICGIISDHGLESWLARRDILDSEVTHSTSKFREAILTTQQKNRRSIRVIIEIREK